jgi:DNA-binding transcriptional LysR family regulator
MLMLSDLTTMALFAEVVDLRSFTAAAVTAGMAKATVSRRIAQLERRLGVRLLQRTTRRVVPTDEGRRLYDRCVQIVAAGKQASELLLDAGTRPSGVLRVGAPIAFTHLHLTPLVVKFLERNPEIELQLLPRSTPTDLVADEIDVAIRIGQPADSSLVVRRLATDAIVAVGAPLYLRRHGTPRSFAELQSHTCLRFSWEAERPSWRYRRRSSCRSAPPLHGNLVASDASVIRDASIQGLGIAILPSHIVAADVRSGRLTRMLEHDLREQIAINLVYAQRRRLPLRTRAFVDFVVTSLTTPAWRESALLVSEP